MSPLGLLVAPTVSNVVLWGRALRARASLVLLLVGLAVAVLAWIFALSPSVPPMFGGYVVVDATSRLFLAALNPIFVGISFHIQHRVAVAPVLRSRLGR